MTEHDFYDRIKGVFQKKAESDKRIQSILKRIESGKATFADTAEYSQLVSELLGSTLSEHLGAETTAYVKEYVCREMLRDQYESMNDLLASVQRALNEKVGLRVAPQRAAFPTERVDVIAHALEDPTVPLDVIKRRAKSPVANVSKSFHDDYIKENAKFRSKAGLKCFIVRTTDGKCCKWCTAMAGRYEYGSEPHDVYRRHDNCGCTVIYESGRQRQDVWTKKTWEVPESAKKYEPVRLSPERAKTLQQAKLLQYRGLTSGGGSGIIKKSGAISGALNPLSQRADEHAERYYAAVRKMTTDVKRISENTGYSEELIQSIKDFVFNEKHDLGDKFDYFVPDYKMAESWQRLIDGKDIKPHDLTLLKHEKMERELMASGYTQEEAHLITSKTYNYAKEAEEYYDQIEKHREK